MGERAHGSTNETMRSRISGQANDLAGIVQNPVAIPQPPPRCLKKVIPSVARDLLFLAFSSPHPKKSLIKRLTTFRPDHTIKKAANPSKMRSRHPTQTGRWTVMQL